MRILAISAAQVLAAANPVAAADTAALQAALGQMPQAVLNSPHPELAQFVDMGVLRDLSGAEVTPRSLDRVRLGRSIRALEALGVAGPEAWSEKAGIAADKVAYFLGFGQTPRTMTIWGLGSEAAAATLMTALGDRDFVPADGAILGNGEPMAMDPAKRDPASPWRSMIGAASFVAQDGNVIIQGPAPEAVAAHTELIAAADHPIVATALAGLAETAGSEPIVQAMLISPLIGIGGFDRATLMTPSLDMDAMMDKLLAQVEAAGDGLPPYVFGIVADIAADRPAVAISLTYADCEMADEAAKLLSERWTSTMAEMAQVGLESGVARGADTLCAATLTITADETSPSANPVFDAVLNAHMRGTFAALQIGATQAGDAP
jgi:hypothetical protein